MAALSIKHSVLTHKNADLGAKVLQAPFLLGSPLVLQIEALLPWQMRAAVLVGSFRWKAEEQCHPAPTPPQHSGATALAQDTVTGDICSHTLAIWPGLTLPLSGNKVTLLLWVFLGREESVHRLPPVGIRFT